MKYNIQFQYVESEQHPSITIPVNITKTTNNIPSITTAIITI